MRRLRETTNIGLVLQLLRVLRFDVFRAITLPIWAALGVVLGGVLVAKVRFGIPFRETMGDPAGLLSGRFYLGFASNVGVMLWTATASIFLFAFGVGRRGDDAQRGRFLLCSGLFVAWLGLDDLFMLHDQVFPDYLSIPQPIIVAGYAALALLYLWGFASVIARTAYPVLIAALGLLGASAALDQISDYLSLSVASRLFVEDGAKLLGIGTWLSYAIHTSASVGSGER